MKVRDSIIYYYRPLSVRGGTMEHYKKEETLQYDKCKAGIAELSTIEYVSNDNATYNFYVHILSTKRQRSWTLTSITIHYCILDKT